MTKIKVAHLRDSCGMYGAERVILTLARHIGGKEFDIMLIALQGGEGKSEKLIRSASAMGIDVRPVLTRGRLDLRALLEVRKILREQSVRILHCHDFKSNFYGLVASIGLPVARIVTAHGSTRDSLRKKAYLLLDEKVHYRFFERVIAVSDRLRTDLEQRGIARGKIEVIPNAIDLSLLKGDKEESGDPECPRQDGGRFVFGVVGRLYPDKGHRFFLEAFERFAKEHPSVSAMIVGDGPEKSEISQLVDAMGLRGRVDVCGEREDMDVVYRGLDAVVIPSLREGLPYVLLESMALKIPVIATSVGDIPVLVKDGETGWLVPPCETDSIERAMRELFASPEKARRMAERGCDLVNRHCSPRSMIDNIESLYRRAIAGLSEVKGKIRFSAEE